MTTIILNPKNYQESYLKHLNKCFPNWGNDMTYDWVFDRKVGKHSSDIIIIKDENNEVIAGSSITYRVLTLKDGSKIDFGIMTGSWTLPEARGKGCFSQIIQESKRICLSKNVPFLTAFVTESNASYRRLKEAGFYCKIANNVFSIESPQSSILDFSSVESLPTDTELIYNFYKNSLKYESSFFYTQEEFQLQYINRLNLTKCLKINYNYFIYEDVGSIIKLLFVSNFHISDLHSFCDWIRYKYDKRVMYFLSDELELENLELSNYDFVKGFFTVQKTDDLQPENYEFFKDIHINLGDKI